MASPPAQAVVPGGGFRRLLSACGGVLAVLLLPLSLSGPTAWLLLPAHLLLTAVAALGAALEGLTARPERARIWGLGYLVATLLVAGGLELVTQVRQADAWYWGPPWLGLVIWGWVPPLVAGLAGAFGDLRLARRRRARRRV